MCCKEKSPAKVSNFFRSSGAAGAVVICLVVALAISSSAFCHVREAASSTVYRGKLPLKAVAGLHCTEEQKKPTRFNLRVIINKSLAVVVFDGKVLSGTFKNGVVNSSLNESDGQGDEETQYMYAVTISRIQSASASVKIRSYYSNIYGTCDLTFEGKMTRG